MRQVIFSKYSNERNRKLAIRTDICQEEGKRLVCKSPMYAEGKEHILKLPEWEQALSKKYENTRVSFNHGFMEGDKICLEYLEGETLEVILDRLCEKKDHEELIDLVRQFIDEIKRANPQKFIMTDRFKEVFGNFNISDEETGADINNIDMIASNIIVKDQKWTVIDYEWTFDFPIPTNFIIYRFIYYYADVSRNQEVIQKYDLYRMFGITESEKEMYRQMEQNFQAYVTKGVFSLKQMYGSISKGAFSIGESLSTENEEEKLRVYFDEGNGFSEENSEYYSVQKEIEKEKSEKRYCFGIKPGLKALRIDPTENPCIIKINKLIGKADWLHELEYETNGYCLDKNTYLFIDNDPWIRVTNIRKEIVQIIFSMEIKLLEFTFAESLRVGLDKSQFLVEETERQKNEQVEQLNGQMHNLEASIREMENSFCWKITKPIRIFGTAIRTILGKR